MFHESSDDFHVFERCVLIKDMGTQLGMRIHMCIMRSDVRRIKFYRNAFPGGLQDLVKIHSLESKYDAIVQKKHNLVVA